jgi:hypothetical protein
LHAKRIRSVLATLPADWATRRNGDGRDGDLSSSLSPEAKSALADEDADPPAADLPDLAIQNHPYFSNLRAIASAPAGSRLKREAAAAAREALEEFRRRRTVDPTSPDVLWFEAHMALLVGDREKAIPLLRQVTEAVPTMPAARVKLGEVLGAQSVVLDIANSRRYRETPELETAEEVAADRKVVADLMAEALEEFEAAERLAARLEAGHPALSGYVAGEHYYQWATAVGADGTDDARAREKRLLRKAAELGSKEAAEALKEGF